MATLLRVPEVAAGATEVVLSDWLVEEGASVEVGVPVVVVETDKAVMEIEAESAGVLLRRLHPGGSSIEVGSAYALVGTSEEADGDVDALLGSLGVGAATPQPDATPESEPEPEQSQPVVAAPTEAPEAPVEAPGEAPRNGRIFAAPIARRILGAAGIALESVTGTGPRGRISKKDAEAAVRAAEQQAAAPAPVAPPVQPAAPQQAAASTPQTAPPADGSTEEPHSRLRLAVARRLTESKQTVPHFYLRRTVRVDALLALRAQLNEVSAQRISVNDLVVRAVGVASRAVPDACVVWTDQALRCYDTVDVGVAVATERGLMTPVVRGVDSLTPSGVARRVRELADAAAAGTLRQGDLEGGTISVSNLGMHGVDEFAAIINPPQSMILAVGAASPAAVVVDGEVVVATTMNLTLSVDHRAIDGALAAQWMAALVDAVHEPMRLLA